MSTSTILEDTSKFSKYTRQELEKLCYNYSRMIAKQEERMKEVNELLASNLAEIRQLKEINRKLNLDNKQLQDLCCFIDNERLVEKKIIREVSVKTSGKIYNFLNILRKVSKNQCEKNSSFFRTSGKTAML